MEFVNSFFLYGLLAISIPVIIHLFNFRRFKKIYFTNIKFIRELKQKTRKHSQLRHLLILLLRILAIICLVFAFAQPYIPLSENKIKQEAQNAISIYIDNSFSLEAESTNGTLIDEAKNKAIEIASIYKNTDLFQLLTNDFEGRHQRFVTRDEFIDLVEQLRISPVVKKISNVIKRQNDLFSSNNSENKLSYIISDFQKSIADINIINEDTNIINYFIPVTAIKTNNLYIDSCWFESPVQQENQQVKLLVRIKNASEIDYEKIPVKLKINNNQKALASFDVKANSETHITLPYTNYKAGIQTGILEITDYPVTFDDFFYFSYKVSSTIPVLCINGTKENVYLNSLFKNDSAFIFKNAFEKNLDYSSFNKYQMIILDELKDISSGLSQEIKRFVENGGTLVVIPSENINIENYKDFLNSVNAEYYTALDTFNTKIDYINLDHRVYNDVFENLSSGKKEITENIDLPVVFSYYNISKGSRSNQETLLKMQNGNIFLNVQSCGKGMIYLFSVPMDTKFSNFTKHAIFVPTLYKLALLSNPVEKLFYTIGDEEIIEIRNVLVTGNNIFKIKKKAGDFEIIPEHRNINSQIYFYTHDQIKEADNYSIFNGENEISGISFNYNRNESDLNCYNSEELQNMLKDLELMNYYVIDIKDKPFTKALKEFNQGIRLWKLFIILALLFLALEVILLRLWK
ncbi:MAG: BatA domain-containing protein [Bacteroidales bacterium]|nr:BatA domain-containing protein [Bacteroidales bacterium]